VTQKTLVVTLEPREQEQLRGRLEGGDFAYHPVAHARFSARGEGVVATLYESGKLVVQGRDVETFAARYLSGGGQGAPHTNTPAADSPATEPTIGSDEAGKGDYFGPLVVAAFKLDPEDEEQLAQGGIMDSKRLSDDRIRKLAPALQERFEFAVETLDPPSYNQEHARRKNLNPMLADLHARAIRRIARPGDHVVIDRFAKEELLEERLSGLDIRLEQFPRAERIVAVAAASVIARFVFLERIRELSEEYAIDLHKGAGAPTDAAARRFVDLHGRDALGEVAKLHFKNTGKLPASEQQ